MYDVIKTKPVAKFFYKGTNSRPVSRTVLITENKGKVFLGYEIQQGNTVRDVSKAPIKSYRKDWIATVGQLRSDNSLRKTRKENESTLTRLSLAEANI